MPSRGQTGHRLRKKLTHPNSHPASFPRSSRSAARSPECSCQPVRLQPSAQGASGASGEAKRDQAAPACLPASPPPSAHAPGLPLRHRRPPQQREKPGEGERGEERSGSSRGGLTSRKRFQCLILPLYWAMEESHCSSSMKLPGLSPSLAALPSPSAQATASRSGTRQQQQQPGALIAGRASGPGGRGPPPPPPLLRMAAKRLVALPGPPSPDSG